MKLYNNLPSRVREITLQDNTAQKDLNEIRIMLGLPPLQLESIRKIHEKKVNPKKPIKRVKKRLNK